MKRTWMIPLTASLLALAACADKPANDASTTNTTSARYPDGTMSSNVNDTSATGAATNTSPDPTMSKSSVPVQNDPNAGTQNGAGWNTSPTNGTQQTWGNGSGGSSNAGASNAGASRSGTRTDTAVPSHDTNLSDASSTNGTYGNAAGASGGAQPGATTPPPPSGASGVTPIDQGNGQSDLRMTQAIRKEVVGNGDLSFTAKNVKIITKNGHVTLKGEVKTQKERDEIEGTAKRVAGAANVDDQVVVKP